MTETRYFWLHDPTKLSFLYGIVVFVYILDFTLNNNKKPSNLTFVSLFTSATLGHINL